MRPAPGSYQLLGAGPMPQGNTDSQLTRAAGLFHEDSRIALLQITEYCMSVIPSGTPACPDSTDRRRRLALQLADMIPGAATVRVSLRDPGVVWPHPHARVWDAEGRPIELSRTRATVAARWIVRVWPDADWTRPHTLDLASAVLTRSDSAAASRRGR